MAVKGPWRGSFLPLCQQMTKTKALCFPESEQEEGQQPEPPQSSTHFSFALGLARVRAGQLGQPTFGLPAAGHNAPSGQVYKE